MKNYTVTEAILYVSKKLKESNLAATNVECYWYIYDNFVMSVDEHIELVQLLKIRKI